MGLVILLVVGGILLVIDVLPITKEAYLRLIVALAGVVIGLIGEFEYREEDFIKS